MVMLGLLWRLLRHRWTRRILLWLAVRLARLFGWRRTLKLLFGGRGRWRLIALGLWRVAVRLLRVGRSALGLTGRPRARRRSLLRPDRRTPRRTGLRPRIARRRDELRRSALAALGMDPDWRPPSRRRLGEGDGFGLKHHLERGARSLR